MSIPTVDSIESDGKMSQDPIVFRPDAFKKSLRNFANHSINLPKVQNKRNGMQARVQHAATLEMRNVGNRRHNQSKQTALDSQELMETSVERKDHSISFGVSQVTESQGLNATNTVPRHVESLGALVPANKKGRIRGPAYNAARNSSTTEKRKLTVYGDTTTAQRLASNNSQLIEPDVIKGNSVDLNNFMAMSNRNVPTRHQGATSVNVLPVIGSEIDYKNAMNRINSKVELTRKDIQNYLVNGSISKEFISTNKKELQKFIKKSGKSTGDFFRGYQTFNGTDKSGRQTMLESNKSLDTIMSSARGDNDRSLRSSKNLYEPSAMQHRTVSKDFSQISQLQNKFVGSNTIYINKESQKDKRSSKKSALSQKPNKSQMDEQIFPDDVKIEKSIKGEISTRALETWINETLIDAHHLEIPGVVVDVKKKKPIYSYGIDPMSLQKSGVSLEDVDRIYKALFVYSVGFFEFLKKILQSTGRNFAIITSIWKVYQVLLEYCCKTDYRILIAELTDRHQEALESNEQMNRVKNQKLRDEKQILRQNLENQQIQCDHFEKERDQEKQHRLKLEDEYMSHQQNHEEEVKLRLKFEGKFNNMHSDHRELQINHERKLVELCAAQKLVKEHEVLAAARSLELIEVKQQNVNLQTDIATLKEYKGMAEKDIRNKTNTLMSAEMQRLEAFDGLQLQRYEVQESVKDLNDIKSKMNMQAERIKDFDGLLDASKKEKIVFEEERDKLQKLNEEISKKFESRHGMIEELTGQHDALECTNLIQSNELEDLRRRLALTTKQLLLLTEVNAETKAKDQTLETSNKKHTTDLSTTQDQLQAMNADRHKQKDALSAMSLQADNFVEERDSALKRIESLKQVIEDSEAMFMNFKYAAGKSEEKLNDSIEVLNVKQQELEADIVTKKNNNTELVNGVVTLKEANFLKSQDIQQLNETVGQQMATIIEFKEENSRLDIELKRLYADYERQNMQLIMANRAKEDAGQLQVNAEQVTETLTQTIRQMRRELREERQQLEMKRELYFITMQMNNERDMMASEEVISRYGMMKEENDEAIRMRDDNQGKLDHYILVLEQIKQMEAKLAVLYKKITNLNEENGDLKTKLKDSTAENIAITKKWASIEQDMKVAHNVEINEMEQKITEIKLKAQQEKNAQIKVKHELMEKQKEMKKELLAAKTSIKSNKSATPVKGKKGPLPESQETGTQTDLDQDRIANLLQAQEKIETYELQLTRAKSTIVQMKKRRSKLIKQLGNNENGVTLTEEERLRGEGSGKQDDDDNSDNEQKDEEDASPSEIELVTSSEEDEEKVGDSDNPEGHDSVEKSDNKSTSPKPDPMKALGAMLMKKMGLKMDGTKLTTEPVTTEDTKGVITSMHSEANKEATERSKDDLVEIDGNSVQEAEQDEEDAKTEEEKEAAQEQKKRELNDLEKQNKLIELFISEEANVLKRIEIAVENGEVVHPSQIKLWRSEIRIPVQLQRVKLTDAQNEELAKRQSEQVQYFRDRALRKIEEGSQYSSDYDAIEESEYLTTDGEGDDIDVIMQQQVMNVKVQREKRISMIEANTMNNWMTKPMTGTRNENDLQKSQDYADNNEIDKNSNDKKSSVLDRMNEMLKKATLLRKSREGQVSLYSHEIDDNVMPQVCYVIMKNSNGEEVRKRRILKQQRMRKKRDAAYSQLREQMVAKRELNRSAKVTQNIKKYTNIYSKFAENLLDTLVEQSKQHLLNQAKNRKRMSVNADVDNISGRERHHKLIQQMKEMPAWQMHLNKLKEELVVQEDKWDHRDEERIELEKKRDEIIELEAEMERVRAQHRRDKIEIIHEDTQIAELQQTLDQDEDEDEEPDQLLIVEIEEPIQYNENHIDVNLVPVRWSLDKDATNQQSKNLEESVEEQPYQEENQETVAMDEVSIMSEEGDTLTAMASLPIQQVQDDLRLQSESHLRFMLEESKAQRETQGVLDAELSDLTKGGVNAVARQSQIARVQMEQELTERQAENEERARKRDIILKQTGMLSKRDEEKKKPGRLGPSSIRTLIRAADSRTNQ